jgi:tetratricopeptide (TPR) repeat protein
MTSHDDATQGRHLGLVMMIKNEAAGLRETLRSVVGGIDAWLILDTGSTDGSQAIVREELGHLPGFLIEEPFVDFSTSRNRMLDLADQIACPFLLMLNGDDVVEGMGELRRGIDFLIKFFCHDAGHLRGAYHVEIRSGALSYGYPRLIRTSARWRFRGVTHEVLMSPSGMAETMLQIPGVFIRQERRNWSGIQARWREDLRLLTAEAERDPRDARTVFYLAQTLECLGQSEEAAKFYDVRVDMGGWPEERFMAALRRGRLLLRIAQGSTLPPDSPIDEVDAVVIAEEVLAEAYDLDPRRPETLYSLAESLAQRGKLARARLLLDEAVRLASVPSHDGALFVETDTLAKSVALRERLAAPAPVVLPEAPQVAPAADPS